MERRALSQVTSWIAPGDIVAVVGASGAGKIAFLRVILGALDPGMAKRREYRSGEGVLEAPPNAKPATLIAGEVEPVLGE